MNDNVFIYFFFKIFLIIPSISYCTTKASQLNRNAFWWGIFAFFNPILAAIWISFKKPIIKWEENIELKIEEPENLIPENEIILPKKPLSPGNRGILPEKSVKTKTTTNNYGFGNIKLNKIDKNSDRY